jgi:hypothetical protein
MYYFIENILVNIIKRINNIQYHEALIYYREKTNYNGNCGKIKFIWKL